jgi:hypothetical protein
MQAENELPEALEEVEPFVLLLVPRGVQKPDRHAAAASSYSWMRPPSRSRRIT